MALHKAMSMDGSLGSRNTRSGAIINFLSFIKTLSYVIGITLGVGSIFAGVWSKFLLPLLYSTFSARKAVTEQQLFAMKTIVHKLKAIRSNKKIYRHRVPVTQDTLQTDAVGLTLTTTAVQKVDQDDAASSSSLKGGKLADSLLIEEVSDDNSHPDSQLIPHMTEPTSERLSSLSFLITPDTHQPSRITRLPELLDDLELCMDATSTTRTSLLSTVSAFTSQLNSQAFQFATRSRGMGAYGSSVGLDTLSQNLGKAGAKAGEGLAGSNEGEQVSVDDIKKEIRGLKGLLLSRLIFAEIFPESLPPFLPPPGPFDNPGRLKE
ncbi:hypothetical protein QFC22_006317 [Naganishia vaughanmartiniae]|uniref:Uncharacterized protein n=1 Tax=Naganishia vaughanmartiniae TaxID=1424756 RepID=A0ACC2WLE5_9TREE|nr:hypothetical protein QFC22_006317 [Naganishia vaughanmartiniae]